jgi:16S rRNA (cytosine1402-N4)-methyltransferase
MKKDNLKYHIPALFAESLKGLRIHPLGIYVDVTFGGGGHARGILDALGENGRLYGFDQDADAVKNRIEDDRFTFIHSNFRYLSNFLRYHGVQEVDGIFADLGVSSHHFDDEERGFSFRFDSALDMRMNNQAVKTAADVLNTYTEEQLSNVLFHYGELKNARRIAATIVRERKKKQMVTVFDLLKALEPFTGREKEKKFLAQVFQALRIDVNQELQALQELLLQSLKWLKPGGRLVIITYHSLEDRLVKNFMKTGNIEGWVEQDLFGNILSQIRMLGRPVCPSAEEIENNPRARSAKLRVAEKVK